jgi:hypothetical protein
VNKNEVVTVEHGRSSLHSPKFGLFYALVIGASLVSPALLWAGQSFLEDPPTISTQQSGVPGNGQQTGSQQPLPKGNGGSGGGQPTPHRDGANSPQGKPPRPHPGDTPRPPQNDGPVVNPNPGPARPPFQGHSLNHPSPRPPAHYPHYGPGHPSYVWGGGNGWRLHQFFVGDMRRSNRLHRHYLFAGGYFPRFYLNRIQPIPPSLMVYLPPVPAGYEVGYYDGYCLLFDPYTLRISSVIDLYRY